MVEILSAILIYKGCKTVKYEFCFKTYRNMDYQNFLHLRLRIEKKYIKKEMALVDFRMRKKMNK